MIKQVSIILGFGFLLLGCKDTGTEVDNKTIPSENVSFSQHIKPVLQLHCGGCHNSSDSEGGLDVSTYGTLTADPNMVFPGNPNNSKLVWRIKPGFGQTLMPPLGSQYKALNQNQVDGVVQWIKEGAKNN